MPAKHQRRGYDVHRLPNGEVVLHIPTFHTKHRTFLRRLGIALPTIGIASLSAAVYLLPGSAERFRLLAIGVLCIIATPIIWLGWRNGQTLRVGENRTLRIGFGNPRFKIWYHRIPFDSVFAIRRLRMDSGSTIQLTDAAERPLLTIEGLPEERMADEIADAFEIMLPKKHIAAAETLDAYANEIREDSGTLGYLAYLIFAITLPLLLLFLDESGWQMWFTALALLGIVHLLAIPTRRVTHVDEEALSISHWERWGVFLLQSQETQFCDAGATVTSARLRPYWLSILTAGLALSWHITCPLLFAEEPLPPPKRFDPYENLSPSEAEDLDRGIKKLQQIRKSQQTQ